MGSRVPARHHSYIRPPSNSDNVHDTETMFTQSSRRAAPKKVIAYVAHAPACMFSEDLVDLAEEVGLTLTIYDVEEVSPPDYITGTPTIETEEGEVYCGDSAFSWVMSSAPSQKENVQLMKQSTPEKGFLSSVLNDNAGCSIEDAMRESERMANVADSCISSPLCDVQKSMDVMLASRKN
jgi:hypothetical protein